mmetsp:Transcript_44847/g.107617  ORF Transcript_44847/g.107617 Transcript_44847/m.107617 type:complete len:442 (+) Transcript_44847:67-1392(+)
MASASSAAERRLKLDESILTQQHDVASHARLSSLLQEVDHLAKKMNTGSSSGAADNNMQLEQLTCTNRQQAAQIQSLSQAAAQREALIGQLQAQLATVRLHDQQLQQQVQAEREQHQQVARQVEQHLQFLKGLAAGAHPQAAHWELLLRLTNAMLQSQGWLQRLSERCAQQGVELPEECVNALAQLGSAANLVSSLGYMAAADGGAGQATRTFGAAGVDQPLQAPPAVQAQPAGQSQAPQAPASPLQMLAEVSQNGDKPKSMDQEALAQQPHASGGFAPPPRPPVRAVPVAATLCRSATGSAANGAGGSGESVMAAPAGMAPAATASSVGSVVAQNVPQSPAWPLGQSPAWSEVAHFLQHNSPSCSLSPSTFCTLLSSPDLHQLESPKVGGIPGLLTGGLSSSSATALSSTNGAAGANANGPVFSQFKRRQQTSLPSNLKV